MRLYIVVMGWMNLEEALGKARVFTSIKRAKEYAEQRHEHWLDMAYICAVRKGKLCILWEFGGYDWSKPTKKTDSVPFPTLGFGGALGCVGPMYPSAFRPRIDAPPTTDVREGGSANPLSAALVRAFHDAPDYGE